MSRINDAFKRAGATETEAFAGAGQVDAVAFQAAGLALDPGIPAPLPAAAAEEKPSARLPQPVDPAGPMSLLESASANLELRLVANPALEPVATEQYRRLAAILHHAQEAHGIRRVLVGSALAEEGKTLTAINLALTLSQSYGRRVLLVDADLRRPGIGHVFQLPHQGGLGEALYNPDHGKLQLVALSDKLSILPAGQPMRDPMAGLSSPTLAAILDEAGETFDWVIVDSPPIGVLSDAKLLAATVDAAILVIAAGRTPCAALQRAADALGRDRIIGVVLNRVHADVAAPGQYNYYQYYGQEPRGNGDKRGWLARLTGRR